MADRSIYVDISKAVNDLRLIGKELDNGIINKALARTINRATTSGRAAASNEIRKTFVIRKKDLDPKVKREPAKATRRKEPTGTLFTFGTPISLSYFRPVQNKKGVKVTIKRSHRTLISHAFLAVPKFKSKGDRLEGTAGKKVFMRTKDGYTSSGVKYQSGGRLPITHLVSVSPGTMFGEPSVMRRTLKRVDETVQKRLPHELDFIIRGIATKVKR